MSNNDDLLKDIQKARTTQSRLDKVKKDVPRWHVFLYQFFHAVDHILSVYLPWAKKFWATVFRWYRTIWSYFVYRRTEKGELEFSKSRAGIFLVASILFLLYGFVPTIGLIFDSTLYLVTAKRDEQIYLSFSQEIDPENNVHSIKGSESPNSDETNGFYFRVEPNLFNQFWSLANKGGMFYPDYVASAIPPGLSQCTVTSYGFRLKTMMRRFEIYPQMLSASCHPISGEVAK